MMLKELAKDKLLSVFSFLTESLLKALKKAEIIAPQYDDLSDEEKAEVDKIVNKMMGRG